MRTILSHLIRFYQLTLAPCLPWCCRFEPSCSEYMKEVIGRRGVVRGLTKGLWRILHCQPFSKGGWDPV